MKNKILILVFLTVYLSSYGQNKKELIQMYDKLNVEHNNLKNHMVLFLSNSSHFVEPLTSDSLPRKSISFNTFWKGMVGVKEEALGSHVF